MVASNLFRRPGVLGWMPDADALNAPEGALLRADNLVLDEIGALALRRGSSKLYSGLPDADIHTLRTLELAGFEGTPGTRRFIGAGDKLYVDGMAAGATFDGSGDLAIGSDSYQAFIARGKVKKKHDGVTLNNWGIPAPDKKPTLAALAALSATAASFDSAESPAFVVNEGTGAFAAGYDGTANGALELTPAPGTGRAAAGKTFASDQDFRTIAGNAGTATDLFDMYVWVEAPEKLESITVMFGLNTTSDAFRDDYYYFDFKVHGTVDVKEAAAYTAAAYASAVSKQQSTLAPEDVTEVKSPQQVSEVLKRLGRFAGPRSRERKDAQSASPAWTHFSVTRGQFNRVGGTAGRTWATVRGFKVVMKSITGTTEKVRFDSAVYFGGGNRALTGTFQCLWRGVRDNGVYKELSPPSPASDPITLNQQGLQITIPAASISGLDPQVNGIWIYLYGGFLDTYYRFVAITNPGPQQRIRLEDFPRREGGANFDTANERGPVAQTEFAWPPDETPNLNVTIDVIKSEVDALIDNEPLEPGSVVPPDNIVAVEGPYANRMFALTAEGWLYPSLQGVPSTFSVYHSIDLRRWGSPLWMVKTQAGLVVGMASDVIIVSGSGDESDDRTQVDLFATPLNVANAPLDAAVVTDGNLLIYRAPDGLMQLSGVALVPLSQGQTGLLWRGQDRHGVQALNLTSGRFRMAIDNHVLYMLAPEGASMSSTSAVWRYGSGKWARTTYPQAALRSIHREPDGALLAGDSAGNVWTLEEGVQDAGLDIPVVLWSGVDDGGMPLGRKDPFDLQFHMDTGGGIATVDLYLDGASMAAASYSLSTPGQNIARANTTAAGRFTRAQVRLTGNFFRFVLQAFNLSYRSLPQHVMAVDTGAIIVGPAEIQWIQEVELDAISPVDLELLVYLDDTLKATLPLVVMPNKRSLYRLTMPRGTKARRPRLAFRTTNPDGAGALGFEPYAVRVRAPGSGNRTEGPMVQVWPVGEAS